MVDGDSHQKVAIDLALGRRPDFPHRQGRHRIAAKFMLRIFDDSVVQKVPGREDVNRLKSKFPDALIRILVAEDTRLAQLPYQDSYSFEIAELFLGADSQRELLSKYRAAHELLPFQLIRAEPAAA